MENKSKWEYYINMAIFYGIFLGFVLAVSSTFAADMDIEMLNKKR